MKLTRLIVALLYFTICNVAAQQNWAAIPCSRTNQIVQINSMFVDSLQNEIILNTIYGYSICNTHYKGMVAYNGNGFHDLDRGIETHDGNLYTGGSVMRGCIRFGNRTLYGGGFLSVGTNTLLAKSIALWDGASWDNFPTPVFANTLNWNSGGGIAGFVRWNGKLWMHGGFDTIGGVVTKNITAFDGTTFVGVPNIPVSSPGYIHKAIVYKNKLIVAGNFYNPPTYDYFRLAQFDGTSWSHVGTGIRGGVGGAWDMAIYNDTLYIAGVIAKSAGNAGNYIMKWDGTQFYDGGFGNFCGWGSPMALINYRNRLYAFGGFECAANQKAFGVAYYENGTWTVPQDSIEGPSILGAVLYKDEIYVGGFFQSINGDTTIKKFAKLQCPDFDAADGCISHVEKVPDPPGVKIYPNPVSETLWVELEENSVVDKLVILNALGQQVYQLLKPRPKQYLDVSTLPKGVYFLMVESDRGRGVYKIVKQ